MPQLITATACRHIIVWGRRRIDVTVVVLTATIGLLIAPDHFITAVPALVSITEHDRHLQPSTVLIVAAFRCLRLRIGADDMNKRFTLNEHELPLTFRLHLGDNPDSDQILKYRLHPANANMPDGCTIGDLVIRPLLRRMRKQR